tara:strand:- start:1927 stop:2340 length:414 start_codon:yes stop_codon:yes gene_type:complete
MIYTLDNIHNESIKDNPVKYSRIINSTKWRKYTLLSEVKIRLSNNEVITIPKGFEWDLASVPQIFHNIIRPNGVDDIAYLIHDYLYQNNLFTRRFSDKEMLRWAKVMKGTIKISLRNMDIKTRYVIVRMFGKSAWNN